MLDNKFLEEKLLNAPISDSAKILFYRLLGIADTFYYVKDINSNLGELEGIERDIKELEENMLVVSIQNGVVLITNNILYEVILSMKDNLSSGDLSIKLANNNRAVKEIIGDYNATCVSLNPVIKATKTKKEAIYKALDCDFNRYDILKAFELVEKSDFLCGRVNNSTWKANFDWIIQPKNLEKILNGNYENRQVDVLTNWGDSNNGTD